MPTENRSSTIEQHDHIEEIIGMVSVPRVPTDEMIVAFAEAWYLKRQAIDDPDMLDAYAAMIAVAPAQQPHPEPIAWMVGTAFWWTKEEAERDAAATGLPIVGMGPMTDASEIERLVAANTEYARRHLEQLGEVKRMSKATAFVQRLVDCSGTQPSVATGYLRDILDELKGNTTPTAPVDRDERAAFEHHHRICDLVRDEDCPEDYRNQSVQDSWEGWQARAEHEIRP